MEKITDSTEFRDRSLILFVIGLLFLLVGIVCAFLGPVEMYCFYLFSQGGPFYYEGFGFGSFMFGNIATQIAGYYLIALVCIPLGYGHLKKYRWARTLTMTLLGFLLVAGVPLIVVFLFILFSSKDLPPITALFIIILIGASYPLLPGLLIRFYRSKHVRLTFETHDPKSYWTEKLTQPILTLAALFLLYAIALHILVLFNGIFPLFGIWLTSLEGIVLIALSILWLMCLVWGTLQRSPWAWWGATIYLALMTISTLLTLLTSTWNEILSKLQFPPTEIEILQGLPLQGYHLAMLVGIPLLLTLGLLVLSKGHFRTGDIVTPAKTEKTPDLSEPIRNQEVLN
jgi:hypothetical protein